MDATLEGSAGSHLLKYTTAHVVRVRFRLRVPVYLPAKRDARQSGRPPFVYFFSAQVFVAASHTPPAFSQSAWVLASVAPAKAGPVNAIVKASANAETNISSWHHYLAFLPIARRYRNPAHSEHPVAQHGHLRLTYKCNVDRALNLGALDGG